jgi:predicted RNase H-like nuclease (RuvC/YqgF family)
MTIFEQADPAEVDLLAQQVAATLRLQNTTLMVTEESADEAIKTLKKENKTLNDRLQHQTTRATQLQDQLDAIRKTNPWLFKGWLSSGKRKARL